MSLCISLWITKNDLIQLLDWIINVWVASKFSITINSLQDFIDWNESVWLSNYLWIPSSELLELRNKLWKKGSIGFIMGLIKK